MTVNWNGHHPKRNKPHTAMEGKMPKGRKPASVKCVEKNIVFPSALLAADWVNKVQGTNCQTKNMSGLILKCAKANVPYRGFTFVVVDDPKFMTEFKSSLKNSSVSKKEFSKASPEIKEAVFAMLEKHGYEQFLHWADVFYGGKYSFEAVIRK